MVRGRHWIFTLLFAYLAAGMAFSQQVGKMLMVTDIACTVHIDQNQEVQMEEGGYLELAVEFGQHLIRAVGENGEVKWNQVVDIQSSKQVVVHIRDKNLEREEGEVVPTQGSSATLLIRVDTPSQVIVDGEWIGEFDSGDLQKVPVAFGEHLVEAVTLDQKDRWEQIVQVDKAAQKIVSVRLQPVVSGRRDGDPGVEPGSHDPTPSPITGNEPVRVGSKAQSSKLVHRVEPLYPEAARRAGAEGLVLLQARIDEQGAVTEVKVIRGHGLLRQAAVDAVRQWKYSPTVRDGEAVAVITTITMNFVLR